MPIYIHLANLVFNKKIISEKYVGGCNQFRIDWDIDTNERNQEDDELFSISAMNADEFEIDVLIWRGLDFNRGMNQSSDFTSITRYGGALWQVDWLNHNTCFAWHLTCNQEQKDKAVHIGEVMTMDKIQDLADQGINVFETIKTNPNLH